MRLTILFAALLLSVGAPVNAASPEVWSAADGRVTFNQARISLPARAGQLAVSETKEFSRPGESLDGVALYRSGDEKVFATVYIYYPGIAHAGLASIATDEAIRLNSPNPVTAHGRHLVDAAGQAGVAVRSDYSGYRNGLASSAAFIKAGRWMIKIRASGPDARKEEVTEAMADLLARLKFEGDPVPRPAALIETPSCAAVDQTDARLLPDDNSQILENALVVGTLDPTGGLAGNGGKPARPPRIGAAWCRQAVQVGGSGRIPLLRATDGDAPESALEGKSLLLALYSDAGGTLEVVRVAPGRYLLLHHEIGSTSLLGSFDALPSDRQIVEVLGGASEAGRVRARVKRKASGDSEVIVPPPASRPST